MAADDYLNGLSVAPLSAKTAQQWTRSAIASPTAHHPWRRLYGKRGEPPAETSISPDTEWAPPTYYRKWVLKPRLQYQTKSVKINGRWKTTSGTFQPFAHEIIRLCDVQAFRIKTAKKVPRPSVTSVNPNGPKKGKKGTDANNNKVAGLSADLSALSTSASSSTRPVIYRYIDVIKSSFALLEAIHFELFMPDRPDLRFLAVSVAAVPEGACEGDYFRVPDADLLSDPSFAVKLGKTEYPVVWEAKQFEKMQFDGHSQNEHEAGLTYILKKKADIHGAELAVSQYCEREFLIRSPLFPDAGSRKEHSIVRTTIRNMGTAQIYAVEPPLPGPKPPKEDVKEKEAGAAGKVDKKKGKKDKKKKKGKGKKEEEEEKPFDSRSEYLKLVYDVRTSSQRKGRVASAVRELDASEAERIEDRLGGFIKYGDPGDMDYTGQHLDLMDELFRLGSRYREYDSKGADMKDAGEMRIDESVILKTINDSEIGRLDECRLLLDWFYGRREFTDSGMGRAEAGVVCGGIRLNAAQSRALRLYADGAGPRVFCILSPPGSGKTTVAAAMAAEVARKREEVEAAKRALNYAALIAPHDRSLEGVQLLLSVQNVAVDNIGAALKKMNYGEAKVYNMKSTTKLDPHSPAPFDFLDLMESSTLNKWRDGTISTTRKVRVDRDRRDRYKRCSSKWDDDGTEYEEKEMSYEECLTFDRREYENKLSPKILLSTVEMVLQKLYTNSKLRGPLRCVSRIIIDEASLLTEAALFCIIRRFPKARIVLIGDDHQLPPFMYDEKILGHELAGRPALSVAMKTGKVPVVELNEVYRAPPSLVAPYNRLAYGGRLVSKKPEGQRPLSKIGLVHSGMPQLLLIDVDGQQERNEKTMSLFNAKEIKAVQRLLAKFPDAWKDEIMIICLYKEQKRRLQSVLGKDFTVLTVDSAQGKEKPIVILMTTRTQIPRQGSFFDSPERCNVSVSRQQKALIILGKATLLTTNKPWSTVVNGEDFTRIKADDI